MTLSLPEYSLRVETDRFGPFVFQIGCNQRQLETLYLRVNDAQHRFSGSPLSQVAHLLEKEVLVSSIFGTNTIEGGTLSKEETEQALDLDPANVQEIEQRRAVNIKNAYDLSRQSAQSDEWHLNTEFFNAIHAAVTDQIPDEYNRPGRLRNNPGDVITYVGSKQHGRRYKPPQYGRDIEKLLSGLAQFNQELLDLDVPVLIRAPLVHYYYELIHPFWDGNGRVGRIVEATLLQAKGFHYAPFAQAGYYLKNIDQYFTLFSVCRKAAMKSREFPITPFVLFFLEGMFESLNKLHDRVNELVTILVYENRLKHMLDAKAINARQYAIVSQILSSGHAVQLEVLRQNPWYIALYSKLTDKTSHRDLKRLKDLELIVQDDKKALWPCF
ncbi:MAG: Fic family protein [Candidatus Scalindua sp.]